jgi:hypothetical protein
MRQNANQTVNENAKDLKLLNMLVATTAAFAICFLAPAMVYFIVPDKDTQSLSPGNTKYCFVICYF